MKEKVFLASFTMLHLSLHQSYSKPIISQKDRENEACSDSKWLCNRSSSTIPERTEWHTVFLYWRFWSEMSELVSGTYICTIKFQPNVTQLDGQCRVELQSLRRCRCFLIRNIHHRVVLSHPRRASRKVEWLLHRLGWPASSEVSER